MKTNYAKVIYRDILEDTTTHKYCTLEEAINIKKNEVYKVFNKIDISKISEETFLQHTQSNAERYKLPNKQD